MVTSATPSPLLLPKPPTWEVRIEEHRWRRNANHLTKLKNSMNIPDQVAAERLEMLQIRRAKPQRFIDYPTGEEQTLSSQKAASQV